MEPIYPGVPARRGDSIDKTIITPGPKTPLDDLQVDHVEQTSTIYSNGDRAPELTSIYIKYKDGRVISYSPDLHKIFSNDGKGKWQSILVDYSGNTVVAKPDGSETVYPKAGTGNTYTVYPRAADGTQKTVTMTSQREPILTVTDASGNIIPPKK